MIIQVLGLPAVTAHRAKYFARWATLLVLLGWLARAGLGWAGLGK